MKVLNRRVETLEAKRPGRVIRSHRIIQHEGQTQDEALDDYGRDKIGPNDFLIVRVIVAPNELEQGEIGQ